MIDEWYSGNHGNSQDCPKYTTGLHFVAYFEGVGAANIFLELGVSPDLMPPLFYATGEGQEAPYIFYQDVDTETRERFGSTSLQYAAYTRREAIIQLLLDKGADTETQDPQGLTPLSHADIGGQGPMPWLLPDQGANIETRDKTGLKLLIYATELGQEATVQSLLDRGADPEKNHEEGPTPLLFAGNHAIVQLLKSHGAQSR